MVMGINQTWEQEVAVQIDRMFSNRWTGTCQRPNSPGLDLNVDSYRGPRIERHSPRAQTEGGSSRGVSRRVGLWNIGLKLQNVNRWETYCGVERVQLARAAKDFQL